MAEEKKEKFESSYPKGVRIAAIIGVIFLVALYIVTLIAGITTSKAAPELFKHKERKITDIKKAVN